MWILLWNNAIKWTGKTPLVQLELQVSTFAGVLRGTAGRGAGLSPGGLSRTAGSPAPAQGLQSSLFGSSQGRTSSQHWAWKTETRLRRLLDMEVCRISPKPEQAMCLILSENNKPFVHCFLKPTCCWMFLLLIFLGKRNWEKLRLFLKWAKELCMLHCLHEDWVSLLPCGEVTGGPCVYRVPWHLGSFKLEHLSHFRWMLF